MSETPGQRMFRQIQEMRDAFPNGFGTLDGVKAELAEKDATIAALRAERDTLRERLARVETLASRWDIHTSPVTVYLVELARELREAIGHD